MNIYELIFRQGIFVHEILHGVFVLPFVIIVYAKSRSLKQVLILFLIAYLLDLDHFVDYFAFYGFTFNVSDFWHNQYFIRTPYRFVILHGWEWFAIMGFLAYRQGKKAWNSVYTPISLGILSHLLLDAINVGNFAFYFFFYRAVNGFIV